MRPKLLVLSDITDKALKLIKEHLDTTNGIKEEYDYIWNGTTDLRSIKPVYCPCTGVSHIDSPKITYLDQTWKDTEGLQITSTAEHTWSLILQLAKREYLQLNGKRIGIIGYGRIGKMVEKYALAFNMIVITHDINDSNLDILLQTSDIITLHLPLNESTYHFIDSQKIMKMSKKPILINTSRANVVDLQSVCEAITQKQITQYGNDFNQGNQSPYRSPNIMSTIHIGGNCKEAREATDLYIANKLIEDVNP